MCWDLILAADLSKDEKKPGCPWLKKVGDATTCTSSYFSLTSDLESTNHFVLSKCIMSKCINWSPSWRNQSLSKLSNSIMHDANLAELYHFTLSTCWWSLSNIVGGRLAHVTTPRPAVVGWLTLNYLVRCVWGHQRVNVIGSEGKNQEFPNHTIGIKSMR